MDQSIATFPKFLSQKLAAKRGKRAMERSIPKKGMAQMTEKVLPSRSIESLVAPEANASGLPERNTRRAATTAKRIFSFSGPLVNLMKPHQSFALFRMFSGLAQNGV
jgi:hypothetical protein